MKSVFIGNSAGNAMEYVQHKFMISHGWTIIIEL